MPNAILQRRNHETLPQIQMNELQTLEFNVGDYVSKTGGDYRFSGKIVAAFHKASGLARYVVENGDGILHIYNGKTLGGAGK